MRDSQYDLPTTIREADQNIAAIERSQSILRQRGDHRGAAEWDQDLAEQRQAREQLVAARNAKFKRAIRRA